jgi:hypothetical protein
MARVLQVAEAGSRMVVWTLPKADSLAANPKSWNGAFSRVGIEQEYNQLQFL